MFAVGLWPVFGDFLHHYRLVISDTVGVIPRLISDENYPSYMYDLWVLSFVYGTSYAHAFRFADLTKITFNSNWDKFCARLLQSHLGRVLFTLGFGYFMIGLCMFVFLPRDLRRAYMKNPETVDLSLAQQTQERLLLIRTLQRMLFVVSIAVAFFVANAYAPSV